MKKVKYSEAFEKLRKKGWRLGHGGKHDSIFHPSNPKHKIPFPRHWTKEAKGKTIESLEDQTGVKLR